MVGPTLSPAAGGRGGPRQPRTSGLWKPAAAAGEQLAPGREGLPRGEQGWGSWQWGARPQPLCWGRRVGAGAGLDWDRLDDRGPFVWGFMACEAALPVQQEAPIGTRLARGAQGWGQEEGEGGTSTASRHSSTVPGFLAAPWPPHTPQAAPALCRPAMVPTSWHHPWVEDAAGAGHALGSRWQVLLRGRPMARTCPAAWLWWEHVPQAHLA